MAMSKFKALWELLSEYSFEAAEDCITDGLTCVICKELISNAYQSECGCQYCYDCIDFYLEEEEDKSCPGNNADCKEQRLVLEGNVNKNSSTNEKISKLKVKCPNQSCVFKIELIEMEEHLEVCPKQPLTCPYITIGCEDEEGPIDSILTHLHEDTFVHTKLLMKCIYNMKYKLSGLKNNFEESKLEISSLKEESRIKEVQIMEQTELFKGESKNKEIHIMKQIEELRIENIKLKEESIMKEIQIMKQIEELRIENKKLKEESIMKETEMKNIIENQNKEIKLLQKEFKEMKKGTMKRRMTIENETDEEVKKRRLNNSIKLSTYKRRLLVKREREPLIRPSQLGTVIELLQKQSLQLEEQSLLLKMQGEHMCRLENELKEARKAIGDLMSELRQKRQIITTVI